MVLAKRFILNSLEWWQQWVWALYPSQFCIPGSLFRSACTQCISIVPSHCHASAWPFIWAGYMSCFSCQGHCSQGLAYPLAMFSTTGGYDLTFDLAFLHHYKGFNYYKTTRSWAPLRYRRATHQSITWSSSIVSSYTRRVLEYLLNKWKHIYVMPHIQTQLPEVAKTFLLTQL